MTCPNCGAEMEQRAFMYVCSFCGSISVAERVMSAQNKFIDALQYYKYIKRNLSSIQQNPHVDVKDLGDTFECVSNKPFHPNDGHFTLVKTLSFWWYAKISRQGIYIALLATMPHSAARNYICFKVKQEIITCSQSGEKLEKRCFPLTLADFDLLSASNDIQIDSNMLSQICPDNYGEFTTYTRRFYNAILDMSKYRYTIDIKLLTD